MGWKHRKPAHNLVASLSEILEPRLLLARDLYVDTASPGPTRDGSSWVSAYADLQLALGAAAAGDRILVAEGLYKPTATTSRATSFALKNGVSLLGGYAGHGAANPDARDVVLYRTTLSGDIGTPDSSADNSYHVIVSAGLSATALLDGFTITAGNASGSWPDNSGGGIYNSSSSPTIANCTFTGNVAQAGGGAFNYSSSSPTLKQCTFTGNSAQNGGAMTNASGSSPTLVNCMISGNSASASGGGVSNTSSSSPTLINCTLSGNSAVAQPYSAGGGIYNSSTSVTLTNCILWGNVASQDPQLAQTSGASTVTYSVVQGGHAGVGNVDIDPAFVRSPWAGPDGVFGSDDDDLGDLHFRIGSPVLNAGSSLAVPQGITTDISGSPRIQGAAVDIGAYEGESAASPARTWYVDHAAPGAATGSGWANAFTDLQSALSAAADGDSIRVASGVYTPTATTNQELSFALRSGVGVFGGYAGYGAANADARDNVLYRTVLSGQIGTPDDWNDNSFHVLVGIGANSATVLDGFTVTAGVAYGSSRDRGAGMLNLCSSPTISSCIFSGNYADVGGGMSNLYSSPRLSNCTFSSNGASWGGGMSNALSSPTLTDCTFDWNMGTLYGGGMYNAGSSPSLVNCLFSGNFAFVAGGAVANDSSSPAITNCTIVSNSADESGGGMFNAYSSAPTLTNCILWGNRAPGGLQIANDAAVAQVTYSGIQGGYAGIGNIDTDPLFARDPSPGTDEIWGTSDDDLGDLRLQLSSPCIDAANNAAPALSGITADLSGNSRLADVSTVADTGAGTAPIVDMGAYEMGEDEAPTVSSVVVNDGSAQRSNVSKLTVRFSDPVLMPAGTIEVVRRGGGAVPNVNVNVANPSGDNQTWEVTFSGAAVIGNSLPDGLYELIVGQVGVYGAAGLSPASSYSFSFHRLFADGDGDRDVDRVDVAQFKTALNRPANYTAHWYFDFDNNGTISSSDLLQLRLRSNRPILV